MNRAFSAFISILRAHLAGQPLALSEPVPWDGILELAKAHSLTAMVGYAVQSAKDVPPAVAASLRKGFHAGIFMDAQLTHLRDQLSRRLTDLHIDHAFLRGICLRDAYPVPALRSMGDIDVLVHMADYDALHEVMTSMGAALSEQDDNHRSYSFPTGATVEFHPNLLRHTSLGSVINPGWQFVQPDAHELDPEGDYLNLLCHLAHHFCEGGTGVRSVMDIWVARQRPDQPDRAKILAVLEEAGLRPFAENIEALAEAWFGAGELTPILESFGQYILTSGVYGTRERMLLSNAAFFGSKWTSLGARIFPPKVILEDSYPWAKGKPILLPAAWICRMAAKVTGEKGGILKRWGKDNLSLNPEAVEAQADLLRSFGLPIPK